MSCFERNNSSRRVQVSSSQGNLTYSSKSSSTFRTVSDIKVDIQCEPPTEPDEVANLEKIIAEGRFNSGKILLYNKALEKYLRGIPERKDLKIELYSEEEAKHLKACPGPGTIPIHWIVDRQLFAWHKLIQKLEKDQELANRTFVEKDTILQIEYNLQRAKIKFKRRQHECSIIYNEEMDRRRKDKDAKEKWEQSRQEMGRLRREKACQTREYELINEENKTNT